MERREIETFLTVAEELHFTRAAERLRVSTARVSQTIKQLERRVGVPLFERTSRRVVLTPVGRRLYEDLRPAYQQIQTGIERAVRAGREVRGLLRVGFVGAAAGQFVLDAARVFQARYPECDVQIRENQVTDAFGPLRADEIDMLLTTLPVGEPDLSTGPVLFREDVLLAVLPRSLGTRCCARLRASPTTGTPPPCPPGRPTGVLCYVGRRSARSRSCSRSSAQERASTRCLHRRCASTSVPTSPMSRSSTALRSSGCWCGGPPDALSALGPSARPCKRSPAAMNMPRLATLDDGSGVAHRPGRVPSRGS